MSDESKKVPQEATELTNADLEQVTGGDISLNYGKIEYTYKQQKPDGSLDGK
jgi:hypothetical protein